MQNINDVILKSGLFTEAQLKRANSEQLKTGVSLTEVILNLGYISKDALFIGISRQLGLKYLRFNDFPKALPKFNYPAIQFMKQYNLVPIGKEGEKYMIAMSDPTDTYAKEALNHFLNSDFTVYLSSPEDIREAISQYFENSSDSSHLMDGLHEDEAEIIDDGSEEYVHQLRDVSHEAPIIKLINMFIIKAIELLASDIHVETGNKQLTVRYRIDGILIEAETYPKKLQAAIISRLKIMSKMNIAERRLPQDGRIKLRVSGREIDLRVSTLPTLYGESVALRVLDRGTTSICMEDMGLNMNVLDQIKKLINMPNGIFLVTGPTGSGKTSTLYAALNKINSKDIKIITIEDPVEYAIEGLNQIQVKPKIGLTFATGLRHIVRQDPDVIMVGEIRDKETADIAIHAALTGHLVFSTLHTNDAPGAVSRLLNMGIESFLLSSALIGVLAQRLVRVICPSCITHYYPPKEILDKLIQDNEPFAAFKGAGCDACKHTGYGGRMGIFELMVVNEDIKTLITNKASTDELRSRAELSGMVSLRTDALSKVTEGFTTIEEVMRVTKEEDNDDVLL